MKTTLPLRDRFTAQGRAGSPLHAVVATPLDEEKITIAQFGSLAPQRGEISPKNVCALNP